MEEVIEIKKEPLDLVSQETECFEIQPELVTIKTEVKYEEESKLGDSQGTVNGDNLDSIDRSGAVSLCIVKEEPEGNDFIIPDIGAPQEPIVSVDGVTEDDLNLNAVEKGKYLCVSCYRRFSLKTHWTQHVTLHSRQKLECHICLLRLNNLQEYERHLASHSLDKKYECHDCGKRFKTSSNLQQHRKTHLVVKPFHCDKCQRQFTVRAHLVKHLGACGRFKISKTPHKCDVCEKTFRKEFLLKSHLRKHTTERPYQCDLCKMFFKYKSALARHIQLHNNDRPFSCEYCNKTFTNAGLLKPHMRKHTGEKPFTCPACDKKFGHKHNMLRHLARHDKKKNLICPICTKVFPKESRLVYHMRSHTNSKPFGCDVCHKKFSHKQNIMRHYEKKHPNVSYVIKITDAGVAKSVWAKVQKKLEQERV